MAGEDPSLSTVTAWPRPPTAAVVVKREGSKEGGNGKEAAGGLPYTVFYSGAA